MTYKQALVKAAAYCAYQERTQQDMREKAAEWELEPEEIEQLIAELIGQKFIDEERFAKAYVRGKYSQRRWGRRLITQGLREKKLSAEQIETVLITSKVSGHPFVNTSPFTLRSLRDHQTQLRANFESYLKGFSKNVREIIERFGFLQQLDKLDAKGLPAHKIGKLWKFKLSEVDAWVRGGGALEGHETPTTPRKS